MLLECGSENGGSLEACGGSANALCNISSPSQQPQCHAGEDRRREMIIDEQKGLFE
ncbi:uncharacterized, partial [Tachysurus ichikawai]